MSNVLVCGVVKNIGNLLINNINLAYQLKDKCNKFKMIIYENNSTDNTKEILKSVSVDNNIKVIMENISEEDIKKNSKIWTYTKVTGSNHSCRIEQICNARNKVIEEINKEEYNDYNIVVWIDLDSKGFDVNEIEQSIIQVKNNEKIVLTANSPSYYDYYALRSKHSIFNLLGPEIIGERFWSTVSRKKRKKLYNIRPINFNGNTSPMEIYSGFNGIGVYHKNVFKNYKYNCMVDDNVKKMYQKMLTEITDLQKIFNKDISNDCNRHPGGVYDADIQGYWKNNSGYDKPVVCEHVCLHACLVNDGYKIYINPNMLYHWNN